MSKHNTTEPVFRLKPTPYSNSCIVKHVGYLTETEKLGDERVDFNTPAEIQQKHGKNVDFLGVIMNYNIKSYIFKNNIIGSFLLKNNILPVYSISVVYEKNIVSGPLFDIFLGFKLDKTGEDLMKTPNKIPNATVYGNYEVKILCDDIVKNNIQEYYDSIGSELITKPEVLAKLENSTEEEFSNYLKQQINMNKTFISELLNGKPIEKFETQTKTIENILRPLYANKRLDNFINFALNKREQERRELYKATEKYELPKRVLNIRDIEKDEKYLNNYLGLN